MYIHKHWQNSIEALCAVLAEGGVFGKGAKYQNIVSVRGRGESWQKCITLREAEIGKTIRTFSHKVEMSKSGGQSLKEIYEAIVL